MKRIAVIILSFTLSTFTLSQWYPQQAGTNYALKSVCFNNANTGYACGYNLVLKTTNGGVNWINSFLQGNHQSIKFTDINTGYICSDSGKIFKTTNSGLNWVSQSSGTINHLTSISFLNSSTGIATGLGKTLIKTTNGGSSWFSIANIIWEIDFLGSKIVSADNYYVTGTESYIIRTTNGGANWIPYTHGEVNPLFTVDFTSPDIGFATGCCGMFMTTTNSGANWESSIYLTLGFTLHSLNFINSFTGYVAGSNGIIYRTTNSGAHWDSTVTTTEEILYSLAMVDGNTGWAVGGFGTILKTTNGGGPGFPIGIEPVSSEIPKEFILHQNYPNPFNPETKIKFEIPSNVKQTSNVKIIIYSSTGEIISNLVDRNLQPGIYEVSFKADGLPSGIYYYNMTFGNYSESKKMVLVK